MSKTRSSTKRPSAPRGPSGRGAEPPASGKKKAAAPAAPTLALECPVVGIGCSAGGLDALERFFANVPPSSGLAYVVVQHLDPEHVSALPQLLQGATKMPVVEASDRVRVEPDHVYVIPPSRDLSLLHGALHLLDPAEPRGMRLPVDFFLRSLAQDLEERSVAVILSGMGSDGVLGLRAVKEKGGLTLAQDPDTARASSMPASAVAAGVVDVVATAELLPARILECLRRTPNAPREAGSRPMSHDGALDKIVILLRDRLGTDFSLYKANTLDRRIERRIAVHQLSGVDAYVAHLREHPQELDLLFKELLIGVTQFFRDPATWDILRDRVFPELFAAHPAGTTLRAWVPACSSGEEAYSLAIVFREALEAERPVGRFSLQIYATDLDPDAIAKARAGAYPKNIAADVTSDRLARFFVEKDEGYRVAKEIRDTVIFAPQNVIADPPFTKLDLLSCRNLLIYFRGDLQRRLLPLFHYALRRDGVLVLGNAETIGSFDHLFSPIDAKARVFRRIQPSNPLAGMTFPSGTPKEPAHAAASPSVAPATPGDAFERLVDQLILQHFAPAAVLVTADGDVLYISGRTGKYLEPAAGRVNVNLHAMARPGLREALTGVLPKALRQAAPVRLRGLRVAAEGTTRVVDVTVQGIETPEPLRGRVLVVFEDVAIDDAGKRPRKTKLSTPRDALMQELLQARESLRVTHEEMQTSVEELKSSNEELQSTNEELQSTNEELTTSKEEMQSLNEELQTVNAELQSKVDDLTWERADMANLLNSTEIATIFLDGGMRVRRFTSHATHLFKLIPSDVGRPLWDVTTDLDYRDLRADAEGVVRTLVFSEKSVRTHDDRWFRVRIMPYRTQDNVIDGVVVTFTDITAIKTLESELRDRST